MFQSLKLHDNYVVAIACVLLACKVEEEPRRIKEVIQAFFDIRSYLSGNHYHLGNETDSVILKLKSFTD